MKIIYRVATFVLLIFLFFCPTLGGAQNPYLPREQMSKERAAENGKIKSLQIILNSMVQLKEEMNNKREALKLSISEGERQELEGEIISLNSRLKSLEDNFAEIASGVDLELFEEEPPLKFDWSSELKDILKPILDDIKGMTESPREIDQLRRKIVGAEEQLSAVKVARENINKLIKTAADKELGRALNKLEKQWVIRQQQLETQLTVTNEQLRQKFAERKTFSETMQELFRIFFKSRGRNFILALLAFFVIGIILWKLHDRVRKSRFFHKMGCTFSVRLFDLVYHVVALLISILASLTVLYLAGDWVLLTLGLIILFGIVWASRHTVPRFWEQAKFFLNLGTVREGERIVYEGLPWQVKSIGFYTLLINKELLGGEIRLPLRHLLDLHSRPWKEQEPWFPCKEGDWVLLADGTHGKVVVQTPEMIELVLLGGSHKVYRTTDFFNQNPMNLSPSFRIKVTFGIDYQHQPIVTEEIPGILETMLNERLTAEGYREDLKSLKVEFQEAGASSLNVEILADFSGKAGAKYYILQRAIHRMCVDACNQYNWVIPFTQLTLHMASE